MNDFNEKLKEDTQEETSNIMDTPETSKVKPLTMKDVKGNVDKLYEEYKRGKIVEFPPWLIETSKGVEILPQELYIHILDTKNILSVKSGNSKWNSLYIYKDGVYILWNENVLRADIKNEIPRRIKRTRYVDEIAKELKTDYANTEESELNSQEDIINFKNGIVNIKTGQLLPHNPSYLSTIQIPCDYNPDLKLEDAPVFSKFLNDLTGGNAEDKVTLLEVIGVAISNVAVWRYKKMVILKGAGNTGKSVFRELLIALIGTENSFTLDIKQLHSRFGASGIYGKRLVGSGDMKFAQIPEIDRIKELTGRRFC